MKELKLSNNATFYVVDEYKGKQMRKLYGFRLRASEEGFDMYEHFDEALKIILDKATDKDGKEIDVTMAYLDELLPADIRILNSEVNSFLVFMNNQLIEEALKSTSDGNTVLLKEEKEIL